MFPPRNKNYDEEVAGAERYFSEAREAVLKGDGNAAAGAYKSGRQTLRGLVGRGKSTDDKARYILLTAQCNLAGYEVLGLLMGRIITASNVVADRFGRYQNVYDSISRGVGAVPDLTIKEAFAERERRLKEAGEYSKKELAEIQQDIAHALENAGFAREISSFLSEDGMHSVLPITANIEASRQELEKLSGNINKMRSLIEGKDAE